MTCGDLSGTTAAVARPAFGRTSAARPDEGEARIGYELVLAIDDQRRYRFLNTLIDEPVCLCATG